MGEFQGGERGVGGVEGKAGVLFGFELYGGVVAYGV